MDKRKRTTTKSASERHMKRQSLIFRWRRRKSLQVSTKVRSRRLKLELGKNQIKELTTKADVNYLKQFSTERQGKSKKAKKLCVR